jgi:hypothetical protein
MSFNLIHSPATFYIISFILYIAIYYIYINHFIYLFLYPLYSHMQTHLFIIISLIISLSNQSLSPHIHRILQSIGLNFSNP